MTHIKVTFQQQDVRWDNERVILGQAFTWILFGAQYIFKVMEGLETLETTIKAFTIFKRKWIIDKRYIP